MGLREVDERLGRVLEHVDGADLDGEYACSDLCAQTVEIYGFTVFGQARVHQGDVIASERDLVGGTPRRNESPAGPDRLRAWRQVRAHVDQVEDHVNAAGT